MRHIPLLATGAAMLAMTAPAAAQVRTAPAPRPEIAGPETRAYYFDRDESPRAALGLNTSSTGTRRDTLGLLIRLGVVGRTHFQFHTSKSEKLLPQLTSEDTIQIRDECCWHAVQLINVGHKQLSHRNCCERVSQC